MKPYLKISLVAIFYVVGLAYVAGQGSYSHFQEPLRFLAGEQAEGRLTSAPGEALCAEYIARHFKEAGLLPGGKDGSWFQTFPFVKYRMASISKPMDFFGLATLDGYQHFYPLSFSSDTVDIFQGTLQGLEYGFREEIDWSKEVIINGIAVIKAGMPEGIDTHSPLAAEARMDKRIRKLEEKGAKAVIVCKPHSGFTDIQDKKLRPRRYQANIPVVFADTTYAFITGFPSVSFSYLIHQIMGEGTNVIAQTNPKKKSNLILGAHYDHLGYGELGGSRKDTFAIHYGADDNASGTAMIMALAEKVTHKSLKHHNHVIIAFSGEELGLLGSQFFAKNPTVPLSQSRAMFNYDMVGRMDTATHKLYIGGTGTCNTWNDILDQYPNDSTYLVIERNPKGTGPTDHTPFYYQKVPVLSFFTGLHSDYHTPFDTEDKINYAGMQKVMDLTLSILKDVHSKKWRKGTYQSVIEEKKEAATFTVTLGIMPDYGFAGKGLKITGVSANGPAHKAGLTNGDIIVKLGEKDINDVYAYMNALSTLSPKQTTTLSYIRNGETYHVDLAL